MALWFILIIGSFYLMNAYQNGSTTRRSLTYTEFYRVLRDNPGNLKSVAMIEDTLEG